MIELTARDTSAVNKYFIDVFRYKFIQYQGRARRKEYWLFSLFSFIFSLILHIIPILGVPLAWLYSLVVILPGVCLGIRRLHDIGKSGWWLLLCLVPLVGLIILIVFFCQDSQQGKNQYGFNPKEAENPGLL